LDRVCGTAQQGERAGTAIHLPAAVIADPDTCGTRRERLADVVNKSVEKP
jgi:hypothetical protein